MEEVLIEPYITIKLDKLHTSVVSDWTGSPTTEQFKTGKNKVLGVLVDNGSSVMVLNYQNMTAYLNLETQVWTINDWFPRVLKEENIKRVGIIIPDKVVGQIVVRSIFSGISAKIDSQNLEIGYFDTVAQLQSWIAGNQSSTQPATSSSSIPITPPSTTPPKQQTPAAGGVDLGGQSSTTDYGDIDDVIHDDPFA